MDFQQLLSKMREIDQPQVEQVAQECGMPMGQMPPPLSAVPPKPDVPPPSLSVNLNAHGMDDIESMMKLLTKVNPDMINPPAPPMTSMIAIKPSLPPLKPLPDFDADNDDMPGGEMDLPVDHNKDHAMVKKLDLDRDGDHDMDDHGLDKKEDGGFQSSTTEPDPEFKNADYMLNKLAGGMNKAKHTFPKVADGDNPMQKVREGEDFKEQIKADLRRRLEESKAVAVSEGPMDMLAKAGGAVKGAFKGAITGAKKAMATPGGGTGKSKQALGKVSKPTGSANVGVSPAQAQAITPEIADNLSQGLKQIADGVGEGNFKDTKELTSDIDFLIKGVMKQIGGAK